MEPSVRRVDAQNFWSPWMCHYLCMPRQRIGCQKRPVLGGHDLMLEGGTHGTLLCSDGDFEATSSCGAPSSAPRQKLRALVRLCAVVWGWRKKYAQPCTQAPIEY